MVQDILQPLLAQAQVTDLVFNVAHSGLTLGDKASLGLAEEGRVAVLAETRARFLFWSRRKTRLLGYLSPADTAVILPRLQASDLLRVRIVGLTPEHLGQDGRAGMQISIWGHQPYVRRDQNRADPPVRLAVPPFRKKNG
mgnify:FL=1|tara:strand:+ start:11232 stop:11651 length:420 start_codon:yes stop_codon:yes gene_type:complete